jgi:transposase
VAARAAFLAEQAGIDPAELIIIDESGFNLAMLRTHGRAPAGVRVVDAAPAHYGPNVSVVGALTLQGVLTCMAVEGATDAAVFETFVEKALVPRLRPGQLIVLDNLSAHKSAAVRAAVEATGARLWFLPPYSPDFSPIEPMWSKVKTLVRSAAARTYEALLKALGTALDRVTPQDARGWFQHCGYTRTPSS